LPSWARKGRVQRTHLHRAAGYAWVTLMLATALSALFIRDYLQFNIAGYTWIHLFVPLTLGRPVRGFPRAVPERHQPPPKIMQGLYFGACIGAGAFTLLPGRYLGQLVWGQWLGLL